MKPVTADLHACQVRLSGDLLAPVVFSVDALRALPAREVEATFQCRRTGLRRHVFVGPLLVEVIRTAGPLFDPGERKDRLRFLIAALGQDGHQAVLSWGEIDPEFADTHAVLGTRMDGRDLDDEGPYLVVPGDRCGGRHISQVSEIRVWAADHLIHCPAPRA
ncbi:hypothetical protein J5X84_09075 [Streptosporangiaceae bacterium NEAU-GS5]|nr:hypothetical protein [Streptosporangiaceae bacterium NEAU-GS5]